MATLAVNTPALEGPFFGPIRERRGAESGDQRGIDAGTGRREITRRDMPTQLARAQTELSSAGEKYGRATDQFKET